MATALFAASILAGLTSVTGSVHWQNTITTGSLLIGAIIALIGLAEAVHFVRRKNRITDLEADKAELQREMENADRTAKRWEVERNAADAAVQRLKLEHLEQAARLAEEQREIRHDLKNQLAACQLELSAATARTDQTMVLEGQKGIIAVIERMDERAAKRDAALVSNQREVTVLLERLADRITGQVVEKVDQAMEKVSEVVQEKVDQLQSDASPDSK